MPEFTKEDKHVVELFQKAMVAREQAEEMREEEARKELDKQFWEYLPARLKGLIMSVMRLHEMPEISKEQIDEAEREVGDLLTMVRMYTLPEVITQLTNEASKKFLKDRMMEKIKNSG